MNRRPSHIDLLEPRVLLSAASATPELVTAPPDAPAPDLTVRFRRRPRGAFVGGSPFRASVVVTSRPAAAARAHADTTAALYLSTDAAVDPADRLLATAPVGPLRPGHRKTPRLGRLTFPADLPSGPYHVLARADDTGANTEPDETNNVADAGTITLESPVVDLVPVKQKTRLRYYAGLSVTGRATVWVRNDGNTDFEGTVSGTYSYGRARVTGVGNVMGHWSQPIALKRGETARIRLRVEPQRPEFFDIYLYTASAPGDPTPNQQVSGPPKMVFL